MGFSDILSDVKGIGDFIGSIFGKDAGKAYPATLPGGVDTKRITNVPNYNNKDWKSSRGYAFQVYRFTPKEDGPQPAEGWKEFRLQINPQEMTQDEQFAIEVTPTFRGVIVEHHGITLKDISLSGTTGISPMRKEGGALANSGKPMLQSGHSGFEEFHELRSYFRAYVEAKRQDDRSKGELRMVFKNFKDNEFIVVEPQKFSMKRSSAKPFMYEYQIAMKGIGQVDIRPTPPKFFERLADTLDDIQNYFDAGVKVINGAGGILLRFERGIESTILNPILAIQQAIIAIKGGKALVLSNFGFTRAKIDYLRQQVEGVETNFNDAIGRDTGKYNALTGRTATLVGTSGRQSTYQELQVLNALGNLKKGLLLIAAQQDALFEQNIFEVNSGIANQYQNKITLPTPNSVSTKTIEGGDDIQTIALRHLGDPDRFREIVLLNNLKPPYISDSVMPGVLRPGQKILIPSSSSGTNTNAARNKEYEITRGMSEAEKNLGVDIRVTEDGDFAISNTKDLDLTAGVENMKQACAIKLALEPGSLKRHQGIGVGLDIGRKSANSVKEIQNNVVATFLADTRVASIPYIDLRQESGTILLNMLLRMRDVDQPVPISIRLNNA